MEGVTQLGGVFVGLLLQSPVGFICAVLMFLYMLRGMRWHAMYAYALVMGAYMMSQTVGFTEFMSGVIVGVIANEVFRLIRKQLEHEHKKKT